MVDGQGNPNAAPAHQSATEWPFSTSHAMKFASKRDLGKDYVVPPLEGLWWAAGRTEPLDVNWLIGI